MYDLYDVERENLMTLSKEQLIKIILDQHHTLSLIGETIVEYSKCHIDDKQAISNVWDYIYELPYYPLWSEMLSDIVYWAMQRNWIEYMEMVEEEVFGDCRGNVKFKIGGTDE